jgi:hypothetical protein
MGHRLFLFGWNSVNDVNIEDLENAIATRHGLDFGVNDAVIDPRHLRRKNMGR